MMKNILLPFFLLLITLCNAQPGHDWFTTNTAAPHTALTASTISSVNIILTKTEYQVNDIFKFTVESTTPLKFNLNGDCGSNQLTYKIYKVRPGIVDTLVYDNTQEIMDCGMPQTDTVKTFTSQLHQPITKPGRYYLSITAANGYKTAYSQVFTIIPFQPRKYYGAAELREPSINFPNEVHFTQTYVSVNFKPDGTYDYNYGNLATGSGTYKVNEKTIVLTHTSNSVSVKNKDLLLSGEYTFYFLNGHLTLHKFIANNSYYNYTFQ